MEKPNSIRPRLRTTYSLHRTDTGRLASGTDDTEGDKKRKVAQLQNVPKKLRDMVVPDPGFVFVGGDWRAMQWCICMWEAAQLPRSNGYHETLLIRFLRHELDPHQFLADHFDGSRQVAKGYTFGRMFLGSPRGLAREAGHTDATGIRVCAAHDKAFRLSEWWEITLSRFSSKRYIQTRGGWRRYWGGPIRGDGEYGLVPNIEHEVLATIIQGNEADICKFTLGGLFREVEKGYPFEPLTTTHDSLLGQTPIKRAEETREWLKQRMENPVPFFDNFSFPAAVSVGESWKEVA